MTQPIAIVGGGHNGLVAAFYLARAGFGPIVFEGRRHVGGGAMTSEISPGFRCPTLSHDISALRQDIVREMALARHGMQIVASPTRVCAPDTDGRSLVLHDDVEASVESIRRLSARDAVRYASFVTSLERVAAVVASLFDAPPPDIANPSAGDLWHLLKTGRKFRALGKHDAFNLLRWAPMPVADLLHDWFDSDLLCAAIAARGISGAMLGPRSAGSALLLLLHEAHRQRGVRGVARGGPGAVTTAMAAAAAAAGADIRTGARVTRILVDDGRAVGVALEDGKEIRTAMVVSAVDPKTTFLQLVDPLDLTPDFTTKARNYRSAGSVAKINLALSALPRFAAILPAEAGSHISRAGSRIHLGPSLDYLERAFDHAKYGEYSDEPWLDVTIPSLLDSSLAPSGAHVMSIYAHCAPYRLRATGWETARDDFRERVMRVLSRYAPGIDTLVVGEQILTPPDLEREHGFFGGHIFHGELSFDQLFTMRPMLGSADYATPIRGLYLCGAGTHPGGFMSGQSGRLAARRIVRET